MTENIEGFLCPISREVMRDPVIASDGHTYERREITMWFEQQLTLEKTPISPMTGKRLTSTDLVANHALRKAIEAVVGVGLMGEASSAAAPPIAPSSSSSTPPAILRKL